MVGLSLTICALLTSGGMIGSEMIEIEKEEEFKQLTPEEEIELWFKEIEADIDLKKFVDPRKENRDLKILQAKKPKGIALTKKEAYLTDVVFLETFKMTKIDFYKLTKKEQDDLKKTNKLV